MRDVLDELERWWRAGEPAGLATVVGTWNSAPRSAGATMAVGPDGTVTGSVSGGCVEGAVYELAREVAHSGVPTLRRYGVSDDDAFAVGLTCGGTLDVYVERVDTVAFPEFGAVAAAIRAGRPTAVATCVAVHGADPARRLGRRLVVWSDRTAGSLGDDRLDAAATDDVRGLLAVGRTGVLRYGYDGQRRGDRLHLFVATYAAPPRMIVFGAIDFAAAVARIGVFLGYRVTVCDARPVFTTARRFPEAHEVVVDWPHRYLRSEAEAGRLDGRTVVCVLTHEPRFDVPVLEVALRLPLAYVGAMGSRRTHRDRLDRLRAAGLTDAELARLSSPLGLDLGARTPEETAVSIAAEIVARRWGGTGDRLSVLDGRIHHDTADGDGAVGPSVPAAPVGPLPSPR
ncbi:XdhC/CoxI family protein [Micromonospora sp. HM5-17]|jgi:xanthine dehydrogenase accessory factor|uniref:XdhC family protein n=1 Tax=Micromonospora sp. HM5-17 TaxID=2487710 RepID=UPI000F4975DE|nr:XdhC/CoxI family protein [Micromonospora sp. HM5-17]ROT29530.1 XshC-Cox1 family protein [Micromonospora sp. HM5-17]